MLCFEKLVNPVDLFITFRDRTFSEDTGRENVLFPNGHRSLVVCVLLDYLMSFIYLF